MAQDEAPELTEFMSERVYRVPIKSALLHGLVNECFYCPARRKECAKDLPKGTYPCGPMRCFIREDAWHKTKLRNSQNSEVSGSIGCR